MKKILTNLFLFTGFFAFVLGVTAVSQAASSEYLKVRPDYSARAVSGEGPVTINILIRISAPEIKPAVERAPVGVALVIDTSGSMADAKKLDYAVRAGKTLVNSLSAKDHLALIEYDSTVTVLSPLVPLKDKQNFIRLLDKLAPGDYTFLSGGLEEGIRQLQNSSFKGVRRVILLSDGLANRGVTSGEAVAAIAAKVRGQGITVSSVGLGLDYDENLMQLMAQRGGGQYYYVRDSEDLPSVFRQELALTGGLVTHKTRARFVGGKTVRKAEVFGYPTELRDGGTAIELSDFNSGEERQMLLTLEVDPAAEGTSLDLGTLNLAFSQKEDGTVEEVNIPLSVTVEKDAARREAMNKEAGDSIKLVRDEVLLVQAEQAEMRAMQELEAGNKDKARQILQENQRAMAVAAPENKAVADRQQALAMTESKLEDMSTDADLRNEVTKAAKVSAYKTAQGKKDGFMLQSSDTGFMVEKLQRALKDKGFYAGEVNGEYDAATEAAVKAFQGANSMTADGVAGPATQRALGMIK